MLNLNRILVMMLSLFNTVYAQYYNGIIESDQANVNGVLTTSIDNIDGIDFIYYENKKYISFGGTDEYLEYPSSVNSGKVYTFSIWFYRNCAVPVTFCGANNYYIFALQSSVLYNRNSSTPYTASYLMPYTTWKHIVVTRNHTDVDFYVNTVNYPASGSTSDNDQVSYKIGWYVSTYYFIGYLDEMAVYNRILTTDEIAELYGGGTPQTCGNPEDIDGLTNYVNFEQTITTITDQVTDDVLINHNMESEDIVEY
jgi:hypothetical protein